MGSTRTSRVGAGRGSRVTVVGRHPVHAGKRHGAVAFDPKVNGRPVENRLELATWGGCLSCPFSGRTNNRLVIAWFCDPGQRPIK